MTVILFVYYFLLIGMNVKGQVIYVGEHGEQRVVQAASSADMRYLSCCN